MKFAEGTSFNDRSRTSVGTVEYGTKYARSRRSESVQLTNHELEDHKKSLTKRYPITKSLFTKFLNKKKRTENVSFFMFKLSFEMIIWNF